MKRLTRHPFIVVVLLILISASLWPLVAGREKAQQLVLEDLAGKQHALVDYRGQVVVVNFWATWCPPCIEELPGLEEAFQQYRAQGLVVLAITTEQKEAVTSFLGGLGRELTFPILIDRRGHTASEWKVRGLPTTFVVDRTGDVYWHAEGQRDFAAGEVNDMLRRALDD
ncbi:MAG: TlpA disulfide reductase family protein [Pseudomonadota bacterium]|nr:TlpA disulfide reductase family protein [Pseudomonadota bacterium]